MDGLIGVAMVDLLRNCGCFTRSASLMFSDSFDFTLSKTYHRSVIAIVHCMSCMLCVIIYIYTLCNYIYIHSFDCREEANEYIEIGALNGLFVLGRSIGFIGKLH